jgi:hypothetical protein
MTENESGWLIAIITIGLTFVLTVANIDVNSHPIDIYTSIDLCKPHSGLSYYSKDNGGDFSVYCLDGSEYHNPKVVEHEH